MKQMHNLSITTGIYKVPRPNRVFCTTTGLESDEHDLTFHGGVDKAVHQYYPGHYSSWAVEFPAARDAFQIGGFGENLVADGNMNERNVCIGDKIKVGKVLLQVSLPRQPCFKLNHRFGIKGFAPNTWKLSRTGWYYRVLKEGWMAVGDEMQLVERKYPRWTIERVQEYLHRDKSNLAKLEELEAIPEFGNECREAFKRLVGALRKDAESGKEKEVERWTDFELVEKKVLTKRISSFVLQAVGKKEGEELDPGSFVRLRLPNGLIRRYSIIGGNTNRIELGVALEDQSRGGSRYLHQTLKQGDKIQVGKITESVPFSGSSSNHVFIAGGIGITAFLFHIDVYSQINFNYELHYAVRSADDIPYKDLLQRMGPNLTLYDTSKGERMDISQILSTRKWNSFVYVCGPQRMIDDSVRAANACGMSKDEIHYEAFQMATSGDPFTADLANSKTTLSVGAEQTLLQVMRQAGLEVDSSCEVGNCGTCRVKVYSGKVEHRGSGLSQEEKEGGESMLSCVSRGVGHIVIDL